MTSLNTLTDETLVKMGRKLDNACEDQNWHALILKLSEHFFSGREDRKRIEEISRERFRQSHRQLGSSGHALLLDLRKKNVSVETLIEALQEIQQEECLELVLPREIPSIIKHPLAVPVMSGGTIELMCKARGFPTPKYQWFVSRGDDPVPLKGQCYMKLVIREATKENEGHYCCRAMNNLGYKFSQYAEVRVALASSYAPESQANRPPVIIQDLQKNIDAKLGSTVELIIEAEGSRPLRYVWFKNANPMEGNTADTLILNNVESGSVNGLYSCQVSNQYGSAISEICEVYETASLAISKDLPHEMPVTEADTLRLELQVQGYPPPKYKWWYTSLSARPDQFDGAHSVPLYEFTTDVLCIKNIQKSHAGSYKCLVSNGDSEESRRESAVCRVVVLERREQVHIEIVEHPRSCAVEMAETVQLHCRAEPRGVTYQWFKDNADNPIAGASKCDLYVRIESERDWGVYMCSVSLGSQPAVVSKRALVYDLLPVKIDPQRIQLGVDRKVELRPVSYETYGIMEFQWYKDDNEIPDEKREVLIIHNPTTRNLGQYRYVAISSEYGHLRSQPQQLSAIEAPCVTGDGSQKKVIVSMGRSFELKCNAIGDDLTYQWTHGDDTIDGAIRSVYQVDRCGANDFGIYKCCVQNEGGKVSEEFRVDQVYDSLHFGLNPSDVNINEGNEMKLVVTMDANRDDFTYKWFCNDQELSYPDISHNLVIHAVEMRHEGVYHCVAIARSGQQFKSTSSRLRITRDPVIGTKSHDVRHVSVDPATRGFSPLLSAPTSSIASNQYSRSLDASSQMSQHSDTASPLPHQKDKTQVVDHDASTPLIYFDTAHRYDDISEPKPYESCIPPAIVIQPEDQVINVGQELILTCQAIGTQALKYQWYFQGKKFGSPENHNSVRLLSATLQHSGRYHCQVSNYKATATTIEVQVTVREVENLKPRFIRSPKPVEMPVGQTVVLSYEIEGERPLEIEWKKDGETIHGETIHATKESTYTIFNARESDSGVYMCVASNRHGLSVSRPTQLTVYPNNT
ncbi:titin-like isoform X3 [Corticium candelabrum]|uniref:titin-like isoform X3 n=1 Tax=Corticium candelabrum TaxID=121492 RepID=UPI002E269C04|nr:titin-like isoform X3 [Corticium candelabrum]